MFSYFLKKRLKKNDAINNIRIREIVCSTSLQYSALSSTTSGVGNHKPHDIVVSLTSFEQRIDNLYLCIESLFQQSLKADHIVLWLSLDNFPNRDLPESLLLQQKRGLDIRFVEDDLGPYKKYVYAFDAFPTSLIITVDDDILYPPDTIDMLYRAYRAAPDTIHCHRAHRMVLDGRGGVKNYHQWSSGGEGLPPSYLTFPTGMGGVLYFPGSLHQDAFKSDKFMALCPSADDIWLKTTSILKGVKSSQLADRRSWKGRFLPISGSHSRSLTQLNWRKSGGNDCKIATVFQEYGIFDKLYSEE